MPNLPERPYYLLHTLVGATDPGLDALIVTSAENRMPPYSEERPVPWSKIDMLLEAVPESPEGVTESLLLSRREVMATVSKPDPAVVYHHPYGLVLDGKIKECFDNDTGKVLQADGTYNSHVFDFTHPTTPDELLGDWYEDFTNAGSLTWNEAILSRGSEVIGAFRDPRLDTTHRAITDRGETPSEYDLFIDKVRRCGLEVLDITAKFGIYPKN
ncbi:MAG TPA: hypothetical protein VK983_03270 [Candidatus Limnocylindrales bacterium]|nr:hypothetical protein [Candidatus Limnocylindrales bacterium]